VFFDTSHTCYGTSGAGIYMRGSVLERPHTQEDIFVTHPSLLELGGAGIVAAETYGDALQSARKRNAQLVGDTALGQTVSLELPPARQELSLTERLERASQGSEAAYQSLLTDVSTEVIEMICKGGAVMDVKARMNGQGELEQFGHTTYHRQKNTLENYPDQSAAFRANTIAEGQNGFLIESLWQKGELADKKFVEFSLILDNENAKKLAGYGYYLSEMIGIIRMTDVDQDGETTITSVLAGGVDQDALQSLPATGDTEQDEATRHELALRSRFDIAVVRRMYELFGYENAYDLSTTELLATPLLVPKAYDALDFAQLYDQIAADITGTEVFFGLTDLRRSQGPEPLTRQHYEAHAQQSRDRQANLKGLATEVTQELLSRKREVSTPLAASKLLREIAKNRTVDYLVKGGGTKEEVKVLGAKTEALIYQARAELAVGNIAAVNLLVTKAKEAARPSGCATDQKSRDADEKEHLMDGSEGGSEDDAKSSESGDEDKTKWKWKRGVCRVSNCPSRPKTTMVGPCAVCHGCQKKFDIGLDPTSENVRPKPAPKAAPLKKKDVALAA
jgi:hypothetical protein